MRFFSLRTGNSTCRKRALRALSDILSDMGVEKSAGARVMVRMPNQARSLEIERQPRSCGQTKLTSTHRAMGRVMPTTPALP